MKIKRKINSKNKSRNPKKKKINNKKRITKGSGSKILKTTVDEWIDFMVKQNIELKREIVECLNKNVIKDSDYNIFTAPFYTLKTKSKSIFGKTTINMFNGLPEKIVKKKSKKSELEKGVQKYLKSLGISTSYFNKKENKIVTGIIQIWVKEKSLSFAMLCSNVNDNDIINVDTVYETIQVSGKVFRFYLIMLSLYLYRNPLPTGLYNVMNETLKTKGKDNPLNAQEIGQFYSLMD